MNRTEFIKQNMSGKVLDVGCSYGTLHERIFNKNVYGIDNAPCKITENFTLGDIRNGTPYEAGFFDTVICGEVIESMTHTDVLNLLGEIRLKLKDNGILIISTPNKDSLVNRIFGTYHVKEHINLYSVKDLKETIVGMNFKIEKLFCLPFDGESNPGSNDLFNKFRKIIHYFLPMSLQEDIIVLARKI